MDRQWVVTAYALAFGSLLLAGGRLGDLYGRKRMFMIGIGGYFWFRGERAWALAFSRMVSSAVGMALLSRRGGHGSEQLDLMMK